MNETTKQLMNHVLTGTHVTRDAINTLQESDVMRALFRHASGDWGECSPEDWAANDAAIPERGRLLSVYRDSCGVTFWIITDPGWCTTTVLLPDDY